MFHKFILLLFLVHFEFGPSNQVYGYTSRSVFQCEGENFNLDCGNETIVIDKGYFGKNFDVETDISTETPSECNTWNSSQIYQEQLKKSNNISQHIQPWVNLTFCNKTDVSNVIAAHCSNKKNCDIVASKLSLWDEKEFRPNCDQYSPNKPDVEAKLNYLVIKYRCGSDSQYIPPIPPNSAASDPLEIREKGNEKKEKATNEEITSTEDTSFTPTSTTVSPTIASTMASTMATTMFENNYTDTNTNTTNTNNTNDTNTTTTQSTLPYLRSPTSEMVHFDVSYVVPYVIGIIFVALVSVLVYLYYTRKRLRNGFNLTPDKISISTSTQSSIKNNNDTI